MKIKNQIKRQGVTTGLLSLSIILFSLAFPGYFHKNGIAFISFIALIPMFYALFRLNYLEALIYGFIFGTLKYMLFNFWFEEFNPTAFAVAPGIHGGYFLMLFPLAIFFKRRFPAKGYLAILILWISYEIFKSTNAVGFSYGVLAQSMYKTHLFTGIADIVGSYYISLLIIFPGLFITFMISKSTKTSVKEWITPSVIYLSLFTASIIYTSVSKVDYSNSETLRMSLIQHDLNNWLSTENPELYEQAYDHLEELSIEGEKESAEVVAWPETAFVPSIVWHKKWRPVNERERYDLIMRLEEYLRSTDALYIIGNNESYGSKRDNNYNTAYLYKKDQILDKYRKINLVPFTEEFPYPERFPGLYQYVLSMGANQMIPGDEQTIFDLNGVKSIVLICYEDAFPELSREGVLNGADLFVNITNDAWTSFEASAMQHLAAAVLRTVENRRTLARAGTSGFTGVIDPNGQIIASIPMFTKDQLTYDVPIYDGHLTIYTRYGDKIDTIPYILLVIVTAAGFFNLFNEKKRSVQSTKKRD